MSELKETSEFLTALTNTGAQAIESFKDGAQLTDAPDFFDEALSWEKGIRGLADGFPAEAKTATDSDIEAMFEPQRDRLIQAGMNRLLAGAIVTNAKGVYYTYAAILQSGSRVVE